MSLCQKGLKKNWKAVFGFKILEMVEIRCDSLASCIVPSSLEGVTDPCPLTEKYLEAHYLCHSPIHGPYTSTGCSGEIDKSLKGGG